MIGMTFDILGWRRVKTSKYQILSRVAKDVLAIHVSTVASKSAFSIGAGVSGSIPQFLTSKLMSV